LFLKDKTEPVFGWEMIAAVTSRYHLDYKANIFFINTVCIHTSSK